jgi:nucleoside-diphosphate-sugar epimerase
MRILVTGATGFIGNHLITELLKQGHKVIATSSSVKKASEYDWFKKVRFIEYKITQDATDLNLFEFFESPEQVIHLAWEGLPNYNALHHIEVNLFAQYNFLKNLITHGLKKLLITGTCLEYGLQNGCLYEDTPAYPSNPYAIAKDTLRKFIEIIKGQFDLNLTWVRLFYMYGNGQAGSSLISQLDQAIIKKEASFNMSLGEQIRDFLPVETVAGYIAKISQQSTYSGIINCCSGQPVSVRKFVENYLKEKGATIQLNLGFYKYPQYEPLAFWGDNTKLNKILADDIQG